MSHEAQERGENIQLLTWSLFLPLLFGGLIYMCFCYCRLNFKEEEIVCPNQLFFRGSGGL